MANSNDGLSWGETTPATADDRKDGADEILGLRKGVRLRMTKEHESLAEAMSNPTASDGGGEHKQGSAKTWFLDDSDIPTQRPDGNTALTSDDNGRLWIDTTSGYVLKVYDDSSTEAGSFENVSGVQKATGSFAAATLDAGEVTAVCGFIPDMFILELHGFTYICQPALNSPATIAHYTTASKFSVTFTLDGTDIDMTEDDFDQTVIGTCYWTALKF